MARGTLAKEEVIKKIAKIFGEDYIGENDKKYYVWADDGGEKVQIALALTCPKNQIEVVGRTQIGDYDFTADAQAATPIINKTEPPEITDEEKENIALLLKRLNL